MNEKKLVSVLNKVAIAFAVILVWWVAIFIVATVFNLNAFRERMTDMFGLSIMGIIAILAGCAIINIMLNLTVIAKSREPAAAEAPARGFWIRFAAFTVAPLLAMIGLLFLGDQVSSAKRNRFFQRDAERIIRENRPKLEKLAYETFDSAYLVQARKILELIENMNEEAPSISILFQDTLEGEQVFLNVTKFRGLTGKSSSVYAAGPEERPYLAEIFAGRTDRTFFRKWKRQYTYFHPLKIKGRTAVLRFEEHTPYGKYGS